jgi:hypothetical protein
LGLPHPLSREEAHSLAVEGLGDSQFPIPTTGEKAKHLVSSFWNVKKTGREYL